LKNYITIKSSNQYLSLFHLFKETHLSFGERCAKELCNEITTSFWRKLLRFQRTFHEKSFVSGFGADAPTDNAHAKSTATPCFLYYHKKSELPFRASASIGFPKSHLKIRTVLFLLGKAGKRTFAPKSPLCFGKNFFGFSKTKSEA